LYLQIFLASTALACVFSPARVLAQAVPVAAEQQGAVTATVAPGAPCAPSLVIPALTPVTLEMMAPLGSKISTSGDSFPLRLAEPVIVDGVTLLPAGATGRGEVVHAKKAGGSGVGGELVLAARYLDVCGQRLRLRSMHLSPNGRSKTKTVDTINMASAAVAPPIALVGFLIKGGEVTVETGTEAEARTATIFTLASPGEPQSQ